MADRSPPAELQDHVRNTYHSIRMGIGLLGALLPLLLWVGGSALDHEPLRSSMSAYYYSPTMRDVFVGGLAAIGFFLYLYRGFSTREDRALNVAGVLAVGVALVPTRAPGSGTGGLVTLHGLFAVLFFACIAYVCLFSASDTLTLIRDTGTAKRLQVLYRVLGGCMLCSPLIAVGLTSLLRGAAQESPMKFFLEAVAVWFFAAYWVTKSWELKATGADALVSEGMLVAVSTPGFAHPGRLVKVEPDYTELDSIPNRPASTFW